MNPGYYAIIPATVRYDKALKANAKLLYAEISSLCNKEGYCWADNHYFAELFDVNHKTISRWISQLCELGYVSSEVNKLNGNSRKITIDENVITLRQKDQEVLTKRSRGIDENVNSYKENNKINIKKNREALALDFFSSNYPSQWEKFLMEYKTKIKDFQKFTADFNDTFDQEQLDYNDRVIRGRLNKYARNWVERQRSNQNNQEQPGAAQPWLRKIS